jgi:2-octaprenyl-6-methoxyphenol hydroxylase
MERTTTDILIAGGGVAGLTAAATLAADGFSVLCVDPVPPVTEAGAEGSDLRSTAFLMPAVCLLERAGLWARLSPEAGRPNWSKMLPILWFVCWGKILTTSMS